MFCDIGFCRYPCRCIDTPTGEECICPYDDNARDTSCDPSTCTANAPCECVYTYLMYKLFASVAAATIG